MSENASNFILFTQLLSQILIFYRGGYSFKAG